MANPKPPTPNEIALTDAQELMQMWLKIKAFFTKANTEDPISRDEEQAFLETKSEVSKSVRMLSPKLPPDVTFAAEKIQDLLRQSISIAHLRGLPKGDRQGLINTWHLVFIHLSRAMGALQFLVEGYIPPPKVKKGAGGNISELKKGAGGKGAQSKSVLKSGKLWFAVILIAVAAFVLLKR